MAKKIAIALAAVLSVVSVLISLQPATFGIERHATINAAPPLVYAQVVDFHRWSQWSAWEKMEQPGELRKSFSGSEQGVGARYEWSGPKTGDGNMTITSVKPNERIEIALNFVKPFKAENTVVFLFTPSGSGTDVSWAMAGNRGFIEKAFSLVMDMDKMVGPDFEAGLAGIKSLAEAETAQAAAAASAPIDPPPVDAGLP